jgi:hypothetical protein
LHFLKHCIWAKVSKIKILDALMSFKVKNRAKKHQRQIGTLHYNLKLCTRHFR